MTRIESDTTPIKQSAETIFNFLSDFSNIGKLMPSQVVNFETDGATCKFTIQGMATLGMAYKSKTPNSSVVMTKHEKAPFDFDLICEIKETNATESMLQLIFDADLNPFLKMMAEKPLKNFLNLLVTKYKEIAEGAA
jgi:carbon monoxide dehydrogenase subunit G